MPSGNVPVYSDVDVINPTVIVGYNHSFRFLMRYHRNCSASGMFVFNGVPSCMEMWRKYIFGYV